MTNAEIKNINYDKALDKAIEISNIYGKDNIYLELNHGKAYLVYYTLTEYKILYEIKASKLSLLSKMTIDFDESNIKLLINIVN